MPADAAEEGGASASRVTEARKYDAENVTRVLCAKGKIFKVRQDQVPFGEGPWNPANWNLGGMGTLRSLWGQTTTHTSGTRALRTSAWWPEAKMLHDRLHHTTELFRYDTQGDNDSKAVAAPRLIDDDPAEAYRLGNQ